MIEKQRLIAAFIHNLFLDNGSQMRYTVATYTERGKIPQ